VADDLPAIPVTFLVPPSSQAPMEIELRHQVLRMVVVDKASVRYVHQFWSARGVYFLLGHADQPERYTAYVGKAPSGLAGRVANHVRSREDPWERALLIASATPTGFDSAAVGWLEGRLYDLLDIAPAAILLNRNRPRDESLPLYDRQVLEQHIAPIAAVLRALGYSPDSPDQRPAAPPRTVRRQFGGTVADLIAAGFLRAGTRLRSTAGVDAVATVLDDGNLEVNDEVYSTPSAAGVAVLGRSINGWDFWAAPSGEGTLVPLAEMRDRLGAEGPRAVAAAPSPPAHASTPSTAPPPAAPASNTRREPKAAKRSAQRYTTTITELIDAGLLPRNGVLTSHFRGGRHEARYEGDRVEVAGRIYLSLSAAAVAVTGRPTNGWDFWHAQSDGRAISLVSIRAEYLRARESET
jgi:hypothetical protein